MKISSAFPSNYLKAADLNDRTVLVKIDRVEMEKIGEDEKPVLYFVGKDKGMVMNKTNANNVASLYGDDTSDWQDQEVVLFSAMVDFQGKSVEAIRLRGPKPADRGSQRKPDPISSGRQNIAPKNDDMNDDIPF